MKRYLLKFLWKKFRIQIIKRLSSARYKLTLLFSPVFFIFHRYPIILFRPKNIKNNFNLICRFQPKDYVCCNRDGELSFIRKKHQKILYWVLNILSLGAYQARVQKALFYTFITLTLEYLNPFNRKALCDYLNRKVLIINRLIHRLPFSSRMSKNCEINLDFYQRASYLQLHIITKAHLAISRQRPNPILQQSQEGLDQGRIPRLSTTGAGGTYFMKDPTGQMLGIFKPFDEEYKAPNNPVGAKNQGALGQRYARAATRVGESCHHEVAAYLVDNFLGFGLVPKTYYASFTHPVFFSVLEDPYIDRLKPKTKYGSFQEYIDGFTPLLETSQEVFDGIALDEFQLLVLLDIIIGNLDRNAGNILIGDQQIVAIDHGLCFPDRVTDELSTWFWTIGPCKYPWIDSIVELLQNFPLEKLALKLQKKCMLETNQIARMKERIALLQAAVAAGLVPFRVAKLFTEKNLLLLVDYSDSLENKAKKIVENYLVSLKKWPWAR